MVEDPYLSKHLSHFGINIAALEKVGWFKVWIHAFGAWYEMFLKLNLNTCCIKDLLPWIFMEIQWVFITHWITVLSHSVQPFSLSPHHLCTVLANVFQTDKTMVELEIDLNQRIGEWDVIQEAGSNLTPLYGPGYTGMRNLGNSCYMNSVMQVLFTIPDFRKR